MDLGVMAMKKWLDASQIPRIGASPPDAVVKLQYLVQIFPNFLLVGDTLFKNVFCLQNQNV